MKSRVGRGKPGLKKSKTSAVVISTAEVFLSLMAMLRRWRGVGMDDQDNAMRRR